MSTDLPPRTPGLRADVILAGLMMAVLTGIGLLTFADMFDGPGTPRQERIAQTPVSPLRPGGLRAFPGAARLYVAERYAFKDLFVHWNSEAKLRLFHHSPYPNVMLGRDGRLFLGDPQMLNAVEGAPPLEGASDRDWLALNERLDRAFAARRVPLVQIFAPDPHFVLTDDLPAWITPLTPPRVSRLVAQMKTTGANPRPVDLAAFLTREHRAHPSAPLYHRSDTHWTEYGAALAVDAALAPLGLPRAGTPPIPAMRTGQGGDLSRMIGQQPQMMEAHPRLSRPAHLRCVNGEGQPAELTTPDPLRIAELTCHNPDASGGRALVFMDSFGAAAVPRFVQIFRDVTFLWGNDVDMAEVDRLRPDVAVRILAARRLQEYKAADLLTGD